MYLRNRIEQAGEARNSLLLGGGRALPRYSPRLPGWAAKEPKDKLPQLGYFVYFDEDGHAYWEYGNKVCIVVTGLPRSASTACLQVLRIVL
jgi:hypothetical protein